MRCIKPFVSGRAAFGCGQCMPCRVNRRRTWAHRIMLEAGQYKDNCFVTLTYGDAPYSLVPEDLQLWLKRFRKRVSPIRIRYFACGEYGDENGRPHFHAALFNFPTCYGGHLIKGECQCIACCAVRETWGYGFVTLRPLDRVRAHYVAGYVTKKLTSWRDTRLSDGQHPEFARMSLRPGIGADALWDVASAMMQYGQSGVLPSQLMMDGQRHPLGRYLRLKLSERLGHTEEERASLSDQALSRLYEEMSVVWSLAISGKVVAEDGSSIVSPQKLLGEVNKPYARALEGRSKIRRRKL